MCLFQETYISICLYHPGLGHFDQLKETVSGERTSHRVNGIAVQTKLVGPMQEQVKHAVVKSKKRSIGSATLEPPTYNDGQRVGPPNVQSVDEDTTIEIQDAKTKNPILFLARMSYPEIQTICSWTGFNIQVRDEVTVVQDTISYLPAINAPATKKSTVNKALNQTLSIMESLQLDKIVCIFDQALYTKGSRDCMKE